MLIDMHMHEMRYSGDSFLKLEQMVELAKRRGLNGICITDHDSMGLKEYAKEYSEKTGFPIFVGIEYFSLQGDIVAFGIEDFPKERIPAQDFISYVQSQGGMCFSAHPFRNNNRGLEEKLCDMQGLHGVEVLNGSTLFEANKKAADYARKLHLAMLGSSDCHVPEKLGIYATYFQKEINSVGELIQAVRNQECMPAYYKEGSYYLWDTKNPIEAPFTIREEVYEAEMLRMGSAAF
ncbi:PHP domain-containing protein [Faecalicatena sp. AGMB00832]|uniref:PHP domain-containing protein n=1 Tax=Faecalicatena faecalis TaxID=2726362 RepID=A0ABS6D320_9FIRM|nr:PHP domain-containing protein [Faecalicatena faecalis]MBU3875576.1 PHP domain-containing protein [Faecalicatena faecalis]